MTSTRTVRIGRKGILVFAEPTEEDRSFIRRVVKVASDDEGMSTAEYSKQYYYSHGPEAQP